jgi:hypothetical protein
LMVDDTLKFSLPYSLAKPPSLMMVAMLWLRYRLSLDSLRTATAYHVWSVLQKMG